MDERLGLGVLPKVLEHRGECRVEGREVRRRRVLEAGATLACEHQVLRVHIDEVGRAERRIRGSLLQPPLVALGEGRDPGRIDHQDVHLRPQIDVRGHVRSDTLHVVHLVRQQAHLEALDRVLLEGPVAFLTKDLQRPGTERPDRLRLDLRRKGAEADAVPVRQRGQGLRRGHGLAESIGEDGQPGDSEVAEPLEHFPGEVAPDHGILEGIAVDQHRGLQRLEAVDPHRVEHACPHPP